MKNLLCFALALGTSLPLSALEKAEGRGIYGPHELASLTETVSRLNEARNASSRGSRAEEAASALGAFSGATPPTTLEEWRAQVATLEKEAEANGPDTRARVPAVPGQHGVFELVDGAWREFKTSPYIMKQGFGDMLAGTGRLVAPVTVDFQKPASANPIFLFHLEKMEAPPCVTTLTVGRKEHVLQLEKVVPGAAWIRRVNWATVRLSKIEPQWFVLEVISPLAPGPYALCIETTVVEFSVPAP